MKTLIIFVRTMVEYGYSCKSDMSSKNVEIVSTVRLKINNNQLI